MFLLSPPPPLPSSPPSPSIKLDNKSISHTVLLSILAPTSRDYQLSRYPCVAVCDWSFSMHHFFSPLLKDQTNQIFSLRLNTLTGSMLYICFSFPSKRARWLVGEVFAFTKDISMQKRHNNVKCPFSRFSPVKSTTGDSASSRQIARMSITSPFHGIRKRVIKRTLRYE